jgi:hypothetical protein
VKRFSEREGRLISLSESRQFHMAKAHLQDHQSALGISFPKVHGAHVDFYFHHRTSFPYNHWHVSFHNYHTPNHTVLEELLKTNKREAQ